MSHYLLWLLPKSLCPPYLHAKPFVFRLFHVKGDLPCPFIEVISKIEKWFEVKPPARWAYAPEGTAQSHDEFSTIGREFI